MQPRLEPLVAGQNVHGPSEAVGRRVLAGEKQCEKIGVNVIIADAGIWLVSGSKHRFEEIGGALPGFAMHPLTRMLDHARSKCTNRLQGSIQLIILGQLKITPIRKERIHPIADHRKNDTDMPLDRVLVGFERVNIRSKQQRCRDVDREVCEVPQGIDIDPGIRASLPTPTQPISDQPQSGEEPLKPIWRKGAGNEATLPAPCVSLE